MILEKSVVISMLSFLCFSRNTVDLDLRENKIENEINISFGSCYGLYDFKKDIFKTITSNSPQLWIWLGDAAYTDYTELSHSTLLLLHHQISFSTVV